MSPARQAAPIEQVAADTADRFNDLLTVITGFAELTVTHLRADHPAHEPANQILAAVRRCVDLLRGIGTFAPNDRAGPVEFGTRVKELVPLLQRLAGPGVALVVAPVAAGCKGATGDVERALMCVCVWARKAMPEGGRLNLEMAPVELVGQSGPEPYVLLTVSGAGWREGLFGAGNVNEDARDSDPWLATVFQVTQRAGGSVQVAPDSDAEWALQLHLPLGPVTC